MVLIVEYREENEQNVETLVKKLEASISIKYGKMQ